MIEKCRMIEFPQKGDDRGHLVIVEGNQDIPFDIKRVFYIYGSDKDVIRGKHANYNSEFVLINVAGTSKVKVDDGTKQKIFSLDRPHTGIFLPRMVWKDMYDFRMIPCFWCLQASTMMKRNISGAIRNTLRS